MVKVKRTFPAPASLEIESKKRTGSYEKPDVIRQLRDDFHNKCRSEEHTSELQSQR